jgi:GNAT superfamily N-acetyltransferase
VITIKECKINQLDLLFEIAIQTYNDTYQYLWTDKGTAYLDRFYKKSDFEKELSATAIFYFLIYDEDLAVGFFKLRNNKLKLYPDEKCLEIDKLYLLKEHSGKGIGKMVMEFIVSFCKTNKYSILSLKAMEESLARQFYTKHGFAAIEKYDLDYPNIKEEYRSILTMVKKIETV